MTSEAVEQALRRVLAEARLEESVRFRGLGRAAQKQRGFIRGQRSLDVARVGGDRLSELGAVVHRELGAFFRRRHQVRGIAEQRDARDAIPAMFDRQRMDGAKHRGSLGVGDERRQRGHPAVELCCDGGQNRRRIGAVETGHPGCGFGQCDIGVQHSTGFAIRRRSSDQQIGGHRRGRRGLGRSNFLGTVSAMGSQLDPQQFPFARSIAEPFRDHDDRVDFLTGVDLKASARCSSRMRPGAGRRRQASRTDVPSARIRPLHRPRLPVRPPRSRLAPAATARIGDSSDSAALDDGDRPRSGAPQPDAATCAACAARVCACNSRVRNRKRLSTLEALSREIAWSNSASASL